MAKISRKSLMTAMAALFMSVMLAIPFAASGQRTQDVVVEETTTITRVMQDGTVVTETITEDSSELLMDKRVAQENMMPVNAGKLRNFMMGLELGTCLDVSGSDLSTFNAELMFGYRHKVVQLLGLMVGVHKSLGSRDSFIPVCLVFRTSFRQQPSLFFLHFNAGYSFNTVARSSMFGDVTACLGAGINLVQQRKFQSNIVLGFGFRHFNQRHQEMTQIFKENVGFAQISLGISI